MIVALKPSLGDLGDLGDVSNAECAALATGAAVQAQAKGIVIGLVIGIGMAVVGAWYFSEELLPLVAKGKR